MFSKWCIGRRIWNLRSGYDRILLNFSWSVEQFILHQLTLYSKLVIDEVVNQSNFIEIILRHGCFPVNLLHIFRTPFPKNTSDRLLLDTIYDSNIFWKNKIFIINITGEFPHAAANLFWAMLFFILLL